MNKIDVFIDELENSKIVKDDLLDISNGFVGTLLRRLSRIVTSDEGCKAIMGLIEKAGINNRIALGWLDSKPGRWAADRLTDLYNGDTNRLWKAIKTGETEVVDYIKDECEDFNEGLTDEDIEAVAEKWIPEVWQEFEDVEDSPWNESASIRTTARRLMSEAKAVKVAFVRKPTSFREIAEHAKYAAESELELVTDPTVVTVMDSEYDTMLKDDEVYYAFPDAKVLAIKAPDRRTLYIKPEGYKYARYAGFAVK